MIRKLWWGWREGGGGRLRREYGPTASRKYAFQIVRLNRSQHVPCERCADPDGCNIVRGRYCGLQQVMCARCSEPFAEMIHEAVA